MHKNLRWILFWAQKGLCADCGVAMRIGDGGVHHSLYATVDRVVPGADGGGYVLGNVLAMHQVCNGKKGSRKPDPQHFSLLAKVAQRLATLPQPIKWRLAKRLVKAGIWEAPADLT